MRQYDDFERVFTFEHLWASYQLCRRGVGWKPSVQMFNQNIGLNLYKLHEELHTGTFISKGFHEFCICERGKERIIKSVTVRERVMQRCLCDYCLVPAITGHLIYDNGASLKSKGYTFAIRRMERHLKSYYNRYGQEGYIARFDFRKYFDSINHDVVEEIVRRYLTDERLIVLIMDTVKTFGSVGLGLGSQVSQILAVAVPNKLDHYIKDYLGIKYYGRYMDDFYIIHHDRQQLQDWAGQIEKQCQELKLQLNQKKTKIRPINGTEFLKIRWYLTDTGRVVKKPEHKSLVRMRRKLKKLKKKLDTGAMTLKDVYASWQSWDAHLSNMDAHKEREEIRKLFKELYGEEPRNVCKANKRRKARRLHRKPKACEMAERKQDVRHCRAGGGGRHPEQQ